MFQIFTYVLHSHGLYSELLYFMYILAIIISQQARIMLSYADVSTEPECDLSFSVLHVKELHANIESTVDFTASHVKWRVSSLSILGLLWKCLSSVLVKHHGAVLVYKEQDHQEQFCFHVFLASNNTSEIKVTRQMDQ